MSMSSFQTAIIEYLVFLFLLCEQSSIRTLAYGDFTLTKIDDYWRCCLGEIVWKVDPEEYERQVEYMAKGETMNEAIENCIENDIDIHTIEENFK